MLIQIGPPLSLNATLKQGGYIAIIQGTMSVGPDRAGLVLELIGDNAPTGAVATWPDTSGLGNNATQGTLLSQPVGTPAFLNSHAAVLFDGVNDYLTIPDLTLSDFELFAVINQTGDNAIMGRAVDGSSQFRIGESGNRLATFDGANNPTSSVLGVAQGGWSLLQISRAGSSVTFRQNGTSYGTGTMTAPNLFQQVGAFQAMSNNLNGYIAHVALFSAALSTEVRQAWETYLIDLYALA